jgi:hypothetical protein
MDSCECIMLFDAPTKLLELTELSYAAALGVVIVINPVPIVTIIMATTSRVANFICVFMLSP